MILTECDSRWTESFGPPTFYVRLVMIHMHMVNVCACRRRGFTGTL